MIIKKFVPCIYLYHEHAVRNLTDTTIVDTTRYVWQIFIVSTMQMN